MGLFGPNINLNGYYWCESPYEFHFLRFFKENKLAYAYLNNPIGEEPIVQVQGMLDFDLKLGGYIVGKYTQQGDTLSFYLVCSPNGQFKWREEWYGMIAKDHIHIRCPQSSSPQFRGGEESRIMNFQKGFNPRVARMNMGYS